MLKQSNVYRISLRIRSAIDESLLLPVNKIIYYIEQALLWLRGNDRYLCFVQGLNNSLDLNKICADELMAI